MLLLKNNKLPNGRQAIMGISFSLGLLLLIPMGCSKDVLEKAEQAKKTNFPGMRPPQIDGFTVNSIAYPGNDSPLDQLNGRKRNDANTLSGPGNGGGLAWVEKDGPGKATGPGLDFLYYNQGYTSRMFTISDQSMALNIYPGAILDGRSINGAFNPKMLLGASQYIRPVTLSTTMPVSGSLVARTSLPRPTAEKALTNAALTDLEALNPGGIGAASLRLELDSFKVYEELKTLYGYNKSIDVFLVDANTIKKGENHYINSVSALKLKFFQENFKIDLDTPSPGQLFDSTGANMPLITGGINPVYVKSVIYGRMGIMVIESQYSSVKLYNAVYKQLGILRNLIGIDRNMTEEEKTIINSANIKVKYTGINADADGMIKVNGLSGFIDVVSANKTYSKESPGVPIAFQLANLHTHGMIGAPFNINYGPFDRPYVKFRWHNEKDTYGQNPLKYFGDLYAYFYRDQAGTIPYNDVPDFVDYPYDITRSSVHYQNWVSNRETRTERGSFKITYSGYRHLLGEKEVSYYVKYGSDANTSRTDFSYQLVPNGYFFLAN